MCVTDCVCVCVSLLFCSYVRVQLPHTEPESLSLTQVFVYKADEKEKEEKEEKAKKAEDLSAGKPDPADKKDEKEKTGKESKGSASPVLYLSDSLSLFSLSLCKSLSLSFSLCLSLFPSHTDTLLCGYRCPLACFYVRRWLFY